VRATPVGQAAVPGGVAGGVAQVMRRGRNASQGARSATSVSCETCGLESRAPRCVRRRGGPTARAAEQVASSGGATPARSPGRDPARCVRRRPAGVAPPEPARQTKSQHVPVGGSGGIVDLGPARDRLWGGPRLRQGASLRSARATRGCGLDDPSAPLLRGSCVLARGLRPSRTK